MTVPNDDGFVGASVTEDQFKQNLVQLLDHIRSLTSGFDLKNGKVYDFASILDFEAIKTKIPAGSIVVIEWGEEYGTYVWDGTNLTKSQYDLLALAKSDATAKAATAKSEAISAAATDASTKAATAETNAKLAAQNTDVNLLLALQKIAQIISDNRDDLDVTDTALLAEDQSINTRVTRLNTGLQGIVDSINQMLIDLDDAPIYFNEVNKLDRLIRQQEFVTELVKLDGFDPENSTEANSVLDSSLLFAFDKPAHIIVIDVTTTAALPTSKLKTVTTNNPDGSTTTTYLDNVISAEIQVNVDGEILHSYCSMQVQGSSSAAYAKKNWTFGFTDKAGVYNSDGIAEFSGNDILLKIGDVKPHQEWVFKSNWIDHTHIRNAMSYNLWQQIMLTRNVFPLRDIDNSYIGKTGLDALDTSATGHPILYPALLRVNGAFYGIGSLGFGKKRQNYNISKNVATEILIGVNNWADIKVLDYTTLDSVGDPTYYEVKAPSTVSKAATYIENFRLFANMSLADFTTNISTYLDKQNIIDFYIFCDFLKTSDLISGDTLKNLQICSWTGTKFFFMPYDLDTVFGLHWAGTSIAEPPNTPRMPTTDATLLGKVYLIYKTDIEARYAQLRKLNVLTINNIYQQSRALTSQYSNEMFSAELARWNSAQPSLNITSLEQILSWTAQRLVFLDTKFNYVA